MRSLRFVIAATLAAAAVPSAFAQQSPAAPAAGSSLDEVVVLGTRRTDRTVTDSASPVDVIAADEFKSQPASNMLDQVKYLVPSFFVPQNTISDVSSLVRAPSLRGLPSDEILVMLNGKRFNRSAVVQVYTGGDTELAFGSQGSDLGSIPSIAIKNLEVLRDGATAQYGSDAIAGVLNYGLREDAGLEFSARYGKFKERSDGKSQQYAVNGGIAGALGFANLSAEYYDDAQTSRGVTRPTAISFAQENPSLANTLPNYPLPAQLWGTSPSHGYKLLLNSALNVTDTSKVYLFANVAELHTDESFNFRSSLVGTRIYDLVGGGTFEAGGRSFFQHPYYLTQCPANNATCPAGGYVQDSNVFNLSSIYPGGFTPRFVGDTKQDYVTAGYKGTSGKFAYDFSVSTSKNKVALSMYDSISPSYGGDSQTSFQFGDLIQKENDVNFDMTYQLDAGLASPLTLSAGLEYRKETYEATPGDVQSYAAGPYAAPHDLYTLVSPGVYAPTGAQTAVEGPGASGYAGTNPTYAGSSSDTSKGVYVGLEGDVTKDLSMGVAARFEDYKSSGNATVGKLNAIWKVNDIVSLRGTVGSGFHAPSPGQNNVQVLTTSFVLGRSLQQGTFPVTSQVAQFYGATPLKPEKSTNLGFGLVLKPTDDFTATVDIYQIKVKNRIFISQSYTVTDADIAALPELANVGAGGTVQYFTNALDTKTKGLDLVATYRTNVMDGRLNLSLAYNYNKSEVTKYDPAIVAFYQRYDIENLSPKNRATFSASWSRGNFGMTVRESYFGNWADANDYPIRNAGGDIIGGQRFGAKFTTDVDLSYTFMDHYTLAIGAQNLFNEFPDKIAPTDDNPIFALTGGTLDGQVYPRSGGPFGINGAFYYGSLRFNFK
jgi:iron complex outermembrane receptor protein